MAIKGHQDFWKVGARVFLRLRNQATEQPWRDMGIIQSVTPTLEEERSTLDDPDGGVKKEILSCTTKFMEQYQLNCSNFSQNNLALLFMSPDAIAFTQSAGAITDIVHYAHPGELVKLKDGSGNDVFDVASVDDVTGSGGVPTYVEGTDWEIVDLRRAFIRMIDGGAFAADANIEIDMTLNEITGNRELRPQTQFNNEYDFKIFWGREDNVQQSVRRGVCRLAAPGFNPQVDNFSDLQLTLTIQDDETSATEPSGDQIYFTGDLPAKS